MKKLIKQLNLLGFPKLADHIQTEGGAVFPHNCYKYIREAEETQPHIHQKTLSRAREIVKIITGTHPKPAVQFHKMIKANSFHYATESLLYNSGGFVMWSLFRTSGGQVTVFYHDTATAETLPGTYTAMDLLDIAHLWVPGPTSKTG